jgi:hypothetical protein
LPDPKCRQQNLKKVNKSEKSWENREIGLRRPLERRKYFGFLVVKIDPSAGFGMTDSTYFCKENKKPLPEENQRYRGSWQSIMVGQAPPYKFRATGWLHIFDEFFVADDL